MSQFPLYLYLVGTYARFLTTGKCLRYPRSLHIQNQSYCNARCSVCPYPAVSRKLEQGEMEWALFERIAEQLTSGSFSPRIVFELHNEPLIDKRIFALVKHIKSKRPDLYCSVVTNGELLDRFTAEDIIQSNLNHLTVSLNAHSKDTYERINIGLSYERVMSNVSTLLSNRYLKPKVTLSYVATRDNVHEVHRATLYWHNRGVATRVINVTNRTGLLDGYEDMMLPSRYYTGNPLSRAWGRLMSVAGRVTGCTIPFHQMNILFNGDCIICCHDWNRATVVGNAERESLKEIWNSEKMNRIRRLVLSKKYKQIDSCINCSLAR